MGNVVVVAEVGFKPDRAEDGFAVLERLCNATHASDPGCILYAFHRVPDDPTRAVVIENWESGAALAEHGATDHIKALSEFDGFAAPPRILILEPLEFGDPEKGLL